MTGIANGGIRGAARAPRFLSAAAACALPPLVARASPRSRSTRRCARCLPPLGLRARSAILVDQATGRVLFERDADLELPPASLAKLMTLHLVYQKLAERVIDREDVVWFGPDAYARHQQPGSSLMALEPGQIVTVGELMKGVAIQSGNDAAMALAEFVAGDIGVFVDWMNEESRFLGFRVYPLRRSRGRRSRQRRDRPRVRGVLAALHRAAPREPGRAALAARVRRTPRRTTCPRAREPTPRPAVTYNHNWLVRGFGVDGLKTGRYDDENFTLAITARRGGLRLVAVLLGVPGATLGEGSLRRSQDGLALLSWGFRTFAVVEVGASRRSGSLRVWKGAARRGAARGPRRAAWSPCGPRRRRPSRPSSRRRPRSWRPCAGARRWASWSTAPSDREVARFDLTAAADVEPAGLLKRAWDTVRMGIGRLLGSAV